MVQVGTRQLKDRLGDYLRIAREGGRVIVTSHGKPVAQIIALDADKGLDDEEAARARLWAMPGVTPPSQPRRLDPWEPLELAGEPLSESVLRDRR